MIKSFEYDLRDVTDDAPNNWQQMRDSNPGAFLRMKVLESPTQATSMFLTNRGYMHIKQPGRPKVYQERHSEEFQTILARVAGHLRTDINTLLRFFYEGQRLHKVLALETDGVFQK